MIEGRRKKKGKQKQRDGSKDRGPGGAEGIRSISQASLPSMCSIEIAEGGGAGSEADIIGPGENNQSAPGQHSKSTVSCFFPSVGFPLDEMSKSPPSSPISSN